MARLVPNTRIGIYEVERWLGGGGMGDVYLATDTKLATRVAIKVIKADVDSEETRQRFLKEARLVAALRSHPNIVPIYQFGEYESRPFFTMEYIEGRSLAALIRDGAPPLTTRLRWLEELCQGLQFAHDHGVIHRDIKPANLMVDELGRLRILDFGIARIADATRTQFRLEGTIPYMAPEAIRDGETDRRVDVFSAAAVAYELLTLTRAFQGDTEATILYNVVSTAPRAFREFATADLDPELEAIVFKGLSKTPDERYETAAQFGAALGDVRRRLESGLGEPAPVGQDQFDSTVRVDRGDRQPVAARHYGFLAGAGALALAVVVLGVLIYFQVAGDRTPKDLVAEGPRPETPADPGLSELPPTTPERPPVLEPPQPNPAGPPPSTTRPDPVPSKGGNSGSPTKPAGPVAPPREEPKAAAPPPRPVDLFNEGASVVSDRAHPGLHVRVLTESDKTEVVVDPDTHIFRTGDRFRFAFRPNIDGYLYVAKEGINGVWSVLFPDPEFNDGSNEVQRGGTVVLPSQDPGDWFVMIEPRPLSGVEKVFVLLSRQPTDVLRKLNRPARSSQTLARADIDSAVSTVATRDIGRQKAVAVTGVNGGSGRPAGTYVVNISDGEAVVLTFDIRHATPQ